MDALIQALFRTEWLIGAAVAVLILGLGGLIALYKPYVIPLKTHVEQLDAERARADRAEIDAAAEIERMREELKERMANFKLDEARRSEQTERLNALILAEARRYADDWRANSHIEAENAKTAVENARISEERIDEVIEQTRLSTAILNAIYTQATGRQQLPPGT